MTTYYIGADVHSNYTELAVEKRGKIVQRYSVPTTIPAIANVLDSLDGKKYLAMEEGPMAGWLYRNLNKTQSSTTNLRYLYEKMGNIPCLDANPSRLQAVSVNRNNTRMPPALPGLLCL